MIKAISLFSGAGGMDVGFKNAGVDVLLANEIDLNAANTWKGVRDEYIKRTKKLRYGCIPFVINAAEYVTPQKFFIGIRYDADFE